MKIRIAAVAVLLLALVVLPPVFGRLAESRVAAHIESLREKRIDVTLDEYERGWFASRAQITLAPSQLHPSAAVLAELLDPLTVAIDIRHGPVSVADGFFLGMFETHARPVGDSPVIDFVVEAHTTLGGSVNFAAEIMPLRHDNADGRISFSGARANGTIERRRIDARGELASLEIESPTGTLSMIGVRASTDSERHSGRVAPGTLFVEIDRFALEPFDASGAFDATGVRFESRSSLDRDRGQLNGRAVLTVQQARTGSGSTVTDARYEMSLRNVDIEALEAYYDLVASSEAAGTPAEPSLDAIEPIVQRLVAGGPGIALDKVALYLDGQPFEASLQIDVDTDALPSGGSADLHDPQYWRSILKGRAALTAAKPLVEQFAAAAIKAQLLAQQDGGSMPAESLDAFAESQVGLMLGMLSAQGMIEDTGNLYRTSVSFDNGRITVNGQPLPF